MITLVEAMNYRCLRYVRRPLKPFHVLVGPNASGKTTFLDIIGFLSDLVEWGLDDALHQRTPNHQELLFRGLGDRFDLAVEARIPAPLRELTARPDLDTVRYEISIGFDDTHRRFEFKDERLLLHKADKRETSIQRAFFPETLVPPESLLTNIHLRNNKIIINKVPGGNDNFYSETYIRSGRGWAPSFRLGPQKSALGNLVADASAFPVATWFHEHLTDGVQRFALNSFMMRRPSPPSRGSGFLLDGSNLPWVVACMREQNPNSHKAWIAHLKVSLPDLVDITTFERPEDRHCYMIYEYAGGLKVPSWLVSDGTLRLTALTLPAYLDDTQGMYLIEEPENGIHPKAVSTAFDSLSSVYGAQVLLATHSPVVLNAAGVGDVLCFAKDKYGGTDIVLGSEHPMLEEWQGEADLGSLLASGVLG